jgi:hypothetical protein
MLQLPIQIPLRCIRSAMREQIDPRLTLHSIPEPIEWKYSCST